MEQIINEEQTVRSGVSFIEANTTPISRDELENKHIIPVFGKDNEPTISHQEFIETVVECTELAIPSISIGECEIRGSHPVKGRVAEARHKASKELLEHEKTLYYERLMFCLNIPSVIETIGTDSLTLTVGGVKCYSQDNLYSSKGSKEHFKVFIGHKVQLCSNLCVWTDGSLRVLAVRTLEELQSEVYKMVSQFSSDQMLSRFENWTNLHLSESQFAHFLGKSRLYPHASKTLQQDVPGLALTDHQIGACAKGFYKDDHFSTSDDVLSLWNAYNLMTGSNKSSYIDSFLERGLSAGRIATELENDLIGKSSSWYLN
jgi:hypothetical protein